MTVRGTIVDGQFRLAAPAAPAEPAAQEPAPEPTEPSTTSKNGRTRRTLDVVRRTPGLPVRKIHDQVGLGGRLAATRQALAALASRGVVLCDPPVGPKAKWYPAQTPFVEDKPTVAARTVVAVEAPAPAAEEPPVSAALVHRLADGQGAPPGTATERLYWLLGRMEAP